MDWLHTFLDDCEYYSFLTLEDFCKLRFVSKRFNRASIAACDELRQQLLVLRVKKRLEYDKTIYDQDFRPRELIRNHLDEIWDQYQEDYIPAIEIIEDDLFAGDDITDITVEPLIEEFETFLKIYREYPSTKIKIYNPAFLRELADAQMARTKSLLVAGKSMDNLVFFHPFCYSKHYRGAVTDTQFINVLCYVNIMDQHVSEDFGDFDERFYVITLEMDDLQDMTVHQSMVSQHISELTEKILKGFDYLEVLELHSFIKAFDLLLNNQRFNL